MTRDEAILSFRANRTGIATALGQMLNRIDGEGRIEIPFNLVGGGVVTLIIDLHDFPNLIVMRMN